MDFGSEHHEIIDEYFKFLLNNEFIFFCNKEELKLFPKISENFEFPSRITNCIIDYSKDSDYDTNKVLKELIELNCLYLQIRFYNNTTLSQIETFLSKIIPFPFSSIHIVLPYKIEMEKDWIWKIYNSLPISQIDFYGVHGNVLNFLKKESIAYPFYFHEKNIIPNLNCGNINSKLFTVNINLYNESKRYNNCLNKKIGIDVNGNIKNCPSFITNYGNVNNKKLSEIINDDNFLKYWKINKNKINTCRNCEFRYICTDCRAYVENPTNIYSKPLKCGYNISTGQWEEWSTNPLKQNSIKNYNLNILNELNEKSNNDEKF